MTRALAAVPDLPFTETDHAELIDALLAEADGLNARLDALLASPTNAAGQGRLWPPNPPGVHSQ